MNSVYFKDLPQVIIRYLSKAQTKVSIAVCWITHASIIKALLDLSTKGVKVELLINYDARNINQDTSPQIEIFLKNGGLLYGYLDANLLHHKFCLIDERILLNGSFNWTYTNNLENLMVIGDKGLVDLYAKEFKQLMKRCQLFTSLNFSLVKSVAISQFFQPSPIHLPELRGNILRGAKIWLIRSDDQVNFWQECIFRSMHLFAFPEIMDFLWQQSPFFDPHQFRDLLGSAEIGAPNTHKKMVYLYCLRILKGDLIIVLNKQGNLLGFGKVLSDPLMNNHSVFRTYRLVHWIFDFSKNPTPAWFHFSKQAVSPFRGSQLELLEKMYQSNILSTG